MAKQLAALLGGMDMQRLAELIRQQGRGKDTVLAHITPKEAMMLKANGGAGTVNPVTGLPEFQDYGFLGGYEDLAPVEQQGFDNQVFAPNIMSQPVDMSRSLIYSSPADTMAPGQDFTQFFDYSQSPTRFETELAKLGPDQGADALGQAAMGNLPAIPSGVPTEMGAGQERNVSDLLKAGAKQVLGTKEGLAGLGTLASVLQARQAGRQARRMQQELSALGAPQRQMGEEMMRLGQAGQVTPVQRQQLEALAARERQQLAQRGLTLGTAQQQAEARQVERTQRAAQDLLDQGIKIAGIGNQYQAAAVKAGYAADQTTREMLNKTLANLYATIYGNVQPPKG
jgi:hypothetical protein